MTEATETLTHLYALVKARRRPTSLPRARGLPGAARPRLLDAGGGLWAVVATVPASVYGEESLHHALEDLDWVSRCAVAHEEIVAALLPADAVVPMKLFTLFLTDERALASVAKRRRALDRVLQRVAGRTEWGVRVTLDEQAALARAERRAARLAPPESGAGFLLRKKSRAEAVRRMASEGRGRLEALHRALLAHADDGRRRPAHEAAPNRLLLDATYLVPARRATRFKTTVKSQATLLGREGYELTLSGPFAPYHFVST